MTWDEILILLIMVMGLFAIDMLVAKFNLKAGRIVAVLTFFVMMPLGLVAGIAALVCMNVRAKKLNNEKKSENISPSIKIEPKKEHFLSNDNDTEVTEPQTTQTEDKSKNSELYQRYQQYIKNHPYMSYTEFLKEEESNERAYFQGKTWY